jgi:hypothetical protein
LTLLSATKSGAFETVGHDRDLWPRLFAQPVRGDEMIADFNAETGVLAGL